MDKWIPKVGERVRVVKNDSLGGKDNGKLLEPGDEVVVTEVSIGERLIGYMFNFDGRLVTNLLGFGEVEPLNKVQQKSNKCNCDIIALMNVGCKCGALLYDR